LRVGSDGSTLAAIGIGSNLGDRAAHVAGAVLGIAGVTKTRLLARGPLVCSEAMVPPSDSPAPQGHGAGSATRELASAVGGGSRFASSAERGGEYLNTAVLVATWLGPEELLRELQRIELRLGRDRSRETQRWTARTIDLDLLIYGSVTLRTPTLVLPHPGVRERWFVLEPLAAIWPECVVPGAADEESAETVQALAERAAARIPHGTSRSEAR
jgi:2-amino-4-hydroxy-6-hydroxymethyldihydropteridine diphosphokinase